MLNSFRTSIEGGGIVLSAEHNDQKSATIHTHKIKSVFKKRLKQVKGSFATSNEGGR